MSVCRSRSRALQALLLASVLLLFLDGLNPSPSWAQSGTTEAGELRPYLDMVEALKEQPVEKQAEMLRNFLEEYPNTSFRPEIEKNLEQLEKLLTATDPKRRREAEDAERYLRAVEFAKKLSPTDRMALWEQFLEENPDSIYREEARKNLEELRAKYRVAPPPPSTRQPDAPKDRSPVVPNLSFKDPQQGLILATLPGLIVPGMGHWYSKSWVLAGVLTAVRLGGIAVGVPGIVQRNNPMIIAGSLLYGFSYLVDVIDAPFSVNRYNERLEKGTVTELTPMREDLLSSAELIFSFPF